jgi:hypothetical protein
MKQLIILILCTAFAFGSFAQNDTTAVKEAKKNVVTVIDNDKKVQVEVGETTNGKKVEVITDEWGDTTHIKIGDQTYKVIEGNRTSMKSGKVNELKNSAEVTEVKVGKKNMVTVSENGDNVHVVVGDSESGKGVEVLTDEWGDTTHIRVGRRNFKVIEGNNGTYVKYEKDDKIKKWSRSMNVHWAGLEVGMNMFENSDYSIYQGTEYEQYGDVFDLRSGKSLSWNLNFMEFAFKNEKKTFGLVTGMGISFNDYAFDLPVTMEKEDGYGITVPVSIKQDDKSVKKSKLHVNYLTVPLMLEVKTPLKMGGSHLSLSAGAIGSLYIGSHTKYKYYDKAKVKIKGNYNINQWKYDLTGRLHFGDFTVFANYSMTSLFETGQGPEIHPLMIGISFPNI